MEQEGKSAQAGGREAVKEVLQINGKSGRREVIKDMEVILL